MAFLQVHGAIKECDEGSHQEASQVVGRAPPVHHCPLLRQLEHLHHTSPSVLFCVEHSAQIAPQIQD